MLENRSGAFAELKSAMKCDGFLGSAVLSLRFFPKYEQDSKDLRWNIWPRKFQVMI